MSAENEDFVVLNASDIQGFDENEFLPLSTEKLSKILAWLAPTNYAATSSEYGKHKSNHLAGTGTWVFQTDQYQLWHDSDKGALWIKAIAGAGKSVIAASLISKLAAEENVPVLYFFFRHIISANQKPQSLVHDYMSQVLEYSPELQHSLQKLVDNRRSLDSVSLDELWKMLVSALARFPRIYCVADALDEMDAGNEFFLHHLVALAEKNPTAIKLLVTSRPVPRVEQVLRHPSILQIAMEPQLVHPDISAYVQNRVSTCDISEKMRSQIHETMCARANGHFLYARLMMDDILEPSKNLLSREEDLLSALDRLPAPMADMYTQMLFHHSQHSAVPQELQLTLLQWVTGSERPLRVLELSSMVDFKQSALEISKETKSVVREGCGPLLEVLGDETVCPIHHSFTEYLYDVDRQYVNSKTATFAVLDYKEAQRAIAVTCIRYLASGWHRQSATESPDDEQKIRALRLKYPFLDYAANNWYRHLRKSGANDTTMVSEVDNFLGDPEILFAWLEFTTDTQPRGCHSRADCLKAWGALHVAATKGLGFYVEYLIKKGYDINCSDLEKHTPLSLAARSGHDEVVATLLKHGALSDEADDIGYKPLFYAASGNHYRVVNVLLASGINPYTPKTKEQRGTITHTPLGAACYGGHVETIKAFIPYLKSDGLHQALSWAIEFGQTKVAVALLEVPGIDINCVVENQTMLYLASHAGNLELMRLLLGMGANPYALSSASISNYRSRFVSRSCYDRTLSPLHAFAKHWEAALMEVFDKFVGTYAEKASYLKEWDVTLMNSGFEMLLDAGLDPNMADPDGLTILHYIMRPKNRRLPQETKCGVENTLSLLFNRGLSAISLTQDGSNALHLASCVSMGVIDMLTARGVDINQIRKSDGKTPLMAALERQDLAIAQLLLDRGADANLADATGNTPLHFLAKLDESQLNIAMIRALIAGGADVNARNKDGNTPMHLSGVKPKLHSTFIENGFDLESKNRKGHTLLFQFISQLATGCHQPCEYHKTLIDAGASPLTSDPRGSTILHSILGRIRSNTIKTTNLLRYFVEKGVDPLSVDNFGNNLWHVIARQGTHYVEEETHDDQQEQQAVMNLLMEYGVPPMARNHAGQTPLHVAFSMSRTSSPGPIDFLLEQTGADVNVADYDKIRPVHLTSSADPWFTSWLLELGADPTMVTVEGQSPLMVACRTRQCNIVLILLEYYKNHNQLSLIDQVDDRGCSALHYACKSGRPETVALLLDAGANINVEDKEGSTPLHMCAEYLDEQASWDRVKVVSQGPRLDGAAYIKAAYVLLTDVSRPTFDSISWQAQPDPIRIRETIRLLVAKGADTSFLTTKLIYSDSNPKGNPLLYSISKGCEAMVSELLIIQDRLLQAKLLHVQHGTVGAEEPGSEVKEDIDAVKKHWMSFLSSYANRVHFLRMRDMPEIMAENIKPGENNVWLIQQLLKDDDEPSVEEASRLGASFLELDNLELESGVDNPLSQMVSWGFTDLMRSVGQDAIMMNTAWAREKAPHIEGRMGRNSERQRCILYTALTREIPNLEMVKLLVSEFMLDPNELYSEAGFFDPVKQSFVHLAACPRHWWQTRALEFLLENGGNIEVLSSSQETPLIAALRFNIGGCHSVMQDRAVEILLLHGANPNAVDEDGLTCLNIAAGRPSCVKLLLKYGANPSLGLRPLVFDVIEKQNLDLLHNVIESGVNVNLLAQTRPELEINKTKKRRKNFQYREIRKEDIFDLDEISKCTYPIHVAASRFFTNTPERKDKAIKIIKLLLEAGANPSLFYKDGTSIMHVLAEQGGLLEPFFHHSSFDTEYRDHRGRTLLLAACSARFEQFRSYDATLIPLLIKRGASLTAVDHDGCNALHTLLSALPRGSGHHSTFLSVSQPFIPTLVAEPDLQGRTPFHYAVAASRFDLIDILLSHGADPLVPDPLDGSIALHHLVTSLPEYKDIMIHYPSAMVPRSRCMNTRQISTFSAELDSSLSFDNAVHQYLRARFVKPEDLADARLRSPRRHMVSLLRRGLSIEARDHVGETPLFKYITATLQDDYTFRDTLFPGLGVFDDIGANFKARNNVGESVLHKLATRVAPNVYRGRGDPDPNEDFQRCFKWLVGKGVDISWENNANRTCLDVAAAAGAQWALDLYKRK